MQIAQIEVRLRITHFFGGIRMWETRRSLPAYEWDGRLSGTRDCVRVAVAKPTIVFV